MVFSKIQMISKVINAWSMLKSFRRSLAYEFMRPPFCPLDSTCLGGGESRHLPWVSLLPKLPSKNLLQVFCSTIKRRDGVELGSKKIRRWHLSEAQEPVMMTSFSISKLKSLDLDSLCWNSLECTKVDCTNSFPNSKANALKRKCNAHLEIAIEISAPHRHRQVRRRMSTVANKEDWARVTRDVAE